MAAPIQQISNGAIPIMSGVAGTPVQQPAVVYQQQQPVIVAGAAPMGYTPRKPYIRNPNEEQCKIFVGGVGKLTNDESLRAYFGKFGEIADSVIMKDKHTNEPRGFAFVTFKTPEAVSAVIEQNNKGGHTLDGKMVDPKPAVPQGPGVQNKPLYDPDKANTTLTTANGAAQMNFQYKGPMKCMPEMKIFVGGIGIGTTEDDVKKYFEQFGKVLAVDMPIHHVYKCPKGFAFVGFESYDAVAAVTKDRYHQINGKTVEVKGSDEQQAHLNKKKVEAIRFASAGRGRGIGSGNIGTVTGYGAYANLAQPVIVNPSPGVQYTTVPAAATGGGYVYDPASNTYYQLPGTVVAGGAVQTVGTSVAAASPYAGATIAAGQQVLTSPQVGQRTIAASDMIQGLAAGSTVALGAAYPSETSTFGPTRHNVIGASAQQPMAGNTVADPHVVYSTATSISAGDAALSTPRGYHPYGR